jgi:hypothetical protein
MDTPETIESFLIQGGVAYDTVEDGLWVVHDDVDQVDNIVVRHSPPIVVFRVKLMEVPTDPKACQALFKKLLELNAGQLLAGAYGLEGNAVVLTETLQSENLDYNEFQAALDGMALAVTEHYPVLKAFHMALRGQEAQA